MTSRKSGLRRCLSRASWLESTLAASISELALAAVGLASSMLKVPLKVLNRPTSSEKPRWPTLNWTVV
ncbi:hypothetical protein D3C74_460740 [compost metagenome]